MCVFVLRGGTQYTQFGAPPTRGVREISLIHSVRNDSGLSSRFIIQPG